ncbi:MAG: hypothetical protein KDE33_00650 [Bacteroidetes bacterium]|nr:hypothetical protein [Bacteroidota bacterium]
MELKIFNEILFGSLKPWNFNISNSQDFAERLNTVRNISVFDGNSLKAAIESHLSKYPALLNEIDYPIDLLIKPMFRGLDGPNPITLEQQFYSKLILLESQRLINYFNQFIADFVLPDDKVYQVEKYLINIKTAFIQCHNYQNEVHEFSNPDLSDFVLNTLKSNLLTHFFDTQNRYSAYVRSPITLADLYIQDLKTTPPSDPQIIPTDEYFYYQIENALNSNDYAALIRLLSEVDSNQIIQSAIENGLFLIEENITVDECFNEDYSEIKFKENKQLLLAEITSKSYGIKRVGIIENALIPYNQFNSTNSIPGKIKSWLNQQLVIYSSSPGNTFPMAIVEGEGVVNNKSEPMPVGNIDHSKNKTIAYNHLAFFKGHNEYQRKIMQEKDFDRLIQLTYELIETDKVPFITPAISQIDLTNHMIRYTFYLIHKELFGTNKIKDHWIDFIHKVFAQFQGTETTTTRIKFSVKPPKYEAIKSAMTG